MILRKLHKAKKVWNGHPTIKLKAYITNMPQNQILQSYLAIRLHFQSV